MADQRFPKRVRLLRPGEFDRVFAARASAADVGIVVYGVENEMGHARLGLAVSRRYGSAVARNRWKRVAREAFRTVQHELPPLDLVCLPRGSAETDLGQLRVGLVELSQRILAKLRGRRRKAELRPPIAKDEP
jgi:ribonuclease P protein component